MAWQLRAPWPKRRTAALLFGKNVANPMAMILAAAALLGHMHDRRATDASRAIYESTLEPDQRNSPMQ